MVVVMGSCSCPFLQNMCCLLGRGGGTRTNQRNALKHSGWCLSVQVLRVRDSLQLTAKYSVATPVNWQNGDKVMVTPNLSDDQANQKVS